MIEIIFALIANVSCWIKFVIIFSFSILLISASVEILLVTLTVLLSLRLSLASIVFFLSIISKVIPIVISSRVVIPALSFVTDDAPSCILMLIMYASLSSFINWNI